MRHRTIFTTIPVLVVLFLKPTIGVGQLHDYGFKFGVQANALLPATEFWESEGAKGSYLARALGRLEVTRGLQMEIGAGYGSIAGLDFSSHYWRTEIIPIDARLLLELADNDEWNPYLYGGLGMLLFRVTTLPASISPNSVEEDGSTVVIPAGIGSEFQLSDGFGIDVSGGINYTLSDNLNYYSSGGENDAYYTVGIALIFGSGNENGDDDNDGLTNGEEKQLKTDRKNKDSDGDGLTDGDEVHKFHSAPLNADTDGDGLRDGDEVMKYKSDPLKADTDGDGVVDGDEVTKYKTDPMKYDSDGDGLNDGDEAEKYLSDPLKVDTDGDGVRDSDELIKYKSDPLKFDTDGGTISDGVEVARGSNPLDPSDDLPKIDQFTVGVGAAIVLDGIVFESGKATIQPQSEEILIKAYNTLQHNPEMTVEIRGYTDNKGKRKTNMDISEDRAEAVKDFLVKKGIKSERISHKGFGPDKPVASNETSEGRAKNRRVEFYRTK